eukprot:CAMPEP_0173441660 /NCGR_PEP_ID=MMETSP1357-20121228/24073_1 /TAXON_ID=77926 /ORGANISM="Hemiselmis rufescens, Strain PCC563" /LENGTH=267 /DNA_ID=CAMNT_0014407253 /DNA_START=206 /DNA_END=1009 /DNA_ORIENTATION=+
MASKIAVVTGANKGIGKEIARILGKTPGVHTIMACRNPSLGQRALEELKRDGCDVEMLPLDIENQGSIDAFKRKLESSYPQGIDVLVNNAAIAFKGADPTPFGDQSGPTIRVNFKGTVGVCEALTPLLRRGGRVSTVASVSGTLRGYSPAMAAKFRSDMSREELLNLADHFVKTAQAGTHNQAGFPNSNYGVSKALVIAYTRTLAKQLKERDILVNCCCPGYCMTDMSSQRGNKSARQGADTPSFLALLPDGSPTGEFWSDRKVLQW